MENSSSCISSSIRVITLRIDIEGQNLFLEWKWSLNWLFFIYIYICRSNHFCSKWLLTAERKPEEEYQQCRLQQCTQRLQFAIMVELEGPKNKQAF